MYRDFVYLDTGRIQSIIAQLQKGVLEKVMEGKSSELQGKAGISAGVLASFLPIEFGGGTSRTHSVQSSKVLHDYAFTIAFDSLLENNLCLEVDEWNRDTTLIPDAAFILARGSMSILDYALLRKLAENERSLEKLFKSSPNTQQQGQKKSYKNKGANVIQQMWTLVDALMSDSLQVRLKSSDDMIFAGTLSREYLRENTQDLIFKYGGRPQKGWVLLAQVCQVTEPSDDMVALSRLMDDFQVNSTQGASRSAMDLINPIVEFLNIFQEAMASVSYPSIAVTPIALYRELESLK